MAHSRPITHDRAPENAGPLARVGAEQRGALTRYVVRLLDGDTVRAPAVVQAALDALLSANPDDAEDREAELCFAACRRRAVAAMRQQDRAKRFDEASALSPEIPEGKHTSLLRQIDRLTPKQQEVLRLKFQNGFRQPAIALIIELPVERVAWLAHTAIARLRADTSALAPTDDPRATASALDELDDAERAAFEKSLRADAALPAQHEALCAFVALVAAALAIEAGARPTPHAADSSQRKKNRRFPALWLVLGALVAASVASFFFLRAPTERPTARPPSRDNDFTLKPATWRQPSPLPASASGTFRADLISNADAASGPSPMDALVLPPTRSFKTPAPTTASPSLPLGGEPVKKNLAVPQSAPGPVDGVAAPVSVTSTPAAIPPASAESDFSPAPAVPDQETPPAPPAPLSPPPAEKNPPASDLSGEVPRAARVGTPTTPAAASGVDSHPPRKSGFSVLPADVDTASVAILRETFAAGRAPAPAGVRVEELLNYFVPPTPAPVPPAAFTATLECAEAPWAPAHRLVRIVLKAGDTPPSPRSAAHLVFLIDVSASMDRPDRLPLVREAMRLLLTRLRPDDRVALVTYAGTSQLTLPSTAVAEGPRIRHALDALKPAGQTNGGAGLMLAYAIAHTGFIDGGVNRVILCTDGDFNLGLTNADELAALAAAEAKTGVSLSVFGFGRGHQIDARLEALAARGRGRSSYVNSRREAERALAGEIEGLLAPVARDLQLAVAFNPAFVADHRLIGYETAEPLSPAAASRTAAPEITNSSQTLVALYEITPVLNPATPAPEPDPASTASSKAEPWLTFHVDYRDPTGPAQHRLTFPLLHPGGRFADASDAYKFSAAVAGFGLILRDSPHRGTASLTHVADWAEAARGDDSDGLREEFVALVRAAQALAR